MLVNGQFSSVTVARGRIQKRYRAADGGAELPQQIEGEGYFVPDIPLCLFPALFSGTALERGALMMCPPCLVPQLLLLPWDDRGTRGRGKRWDDVPTGNPACTMAPRSRQPIERKPGTSWHGTQSRDALARNQEGKRVVVGVVRSNRQVSNVAACLSSAFWGRRGWR